MTDPNTGRLTDTDLDEIASRAGHLFEYVTMPSEADQLAGVDVPALLDEVRRLRAVPSAAAGRSALRAMHDASTAREHELIEERDKLVRWHGEDEAALKKMRATIERLRTEKRELGELAARRESELIHYRKLAAKTPAGRADDDPRSIPVYTPGMAPGEEIAMLRRTLIAAEDSRVELRAENARLRDRLWKRDTDRAELRDRIAEALYAHSHPGWATRYTDLDRDERETYLARASAVLAVLPSPVDRGAVLAEAIARITGMPGYPRLVLPEEMLAELRRMADEAEYVATPCSVGGCDPGGEPCSTHERLMGHGEGDHELCEPGCDGPNRMADSRPRCPDCQMPHDLTPGMALVCTSIRASIADQGCVADEAQQPESQARVLASALDGLGRLIATSSRDWGVYRVDAWLWAVLVGWDDETVAKARRYRAAVRAVVESGKEA